MDTEITVWFSVYNTKLGNQEFSSYKLNTSSS